MSLLGDLITKVDSLATTAGAAVKATRVKVQTSAPSSPYDGQLWYDSDDTGADGVPWTSYVPDIQGSTTDPVPGGASTFLGAYTVTPEKICHYRIFLLAGTGMTFGTGNWTIKLPVPAANNKRDSVIGGVGLRDASPAAVAYRLAVLVADGGQYLYLRDMAGATVTNLVPWTWAVGDSLNVDGSYEVA